MITIEEWMQTVEYRISDGSDFLWLCYGDNAHCLDSIGKNQSSASIVFDRTNQCVYEVSVCDALHNRAYRMIHPDYAKAHQQESQERSVEDVAWEGVPWIDLELPEDFMLKAAAILKGDAYDTGILVPLDLEEEELQMLEKISIEQGITKDQVVENILRAHIEAAQKS